MLRVTPRGQILLSQRFTLEMDCHMDFRHFPFDCQLCPIELESFGYTTNGTIHEPKAVMESVYQNGIWFVKNERKVQFGFRRIFNAFETDWKKRITD